MNEVLKAMKERRSIRKFKSDMLQKKLLIRLLKVDFMLQVEKDNNLLLLFL